MEFKDRQDNDQLEPTSKVFFFFCFIFILFFFVAFQIIMFKNVLPWLLWWWWWWMVAGGWWMSEIEFHINIFVILIFDHIFYQTLHSTHKYIYILIHTLVLYALTLFPSQCSSLCCVFLNTYNITFLITNHET